jgi:aromatic ring-opening dioxygenase LigB subunit
MAWEDRTKAQKAVARRAARRYAETDDNITYVVITPKGTRLIVTGITSAKAVAGKDGAIEKA